MLSINTNVGALQAASASYSVNKSMETSMQRLSTGKRINSAADDAAGLQISQRLTAEIKGINQSIRNAADAHAMLATAEGAAIEIHAILQRMRELAVQASNGTMQDADRNAVQSEFVALEAEVNRINDNTTWGGQQLTDGTFTTTAGGVFHVGPDGGQTITHAIEDLATTAIGSSTNNGITCRSKYCYCGDRCSDLYSWNRERADGCCDEQARPCYCEPTKCINKFAVSCGTN